MISDKGNDKTDEIELNVSITIKKNDFDRYTRICNVLGFDTIEDKIANDAKDLINKSMKHVR